MAQNQLVQLHKNGEQKTVKMGFSWWVLFFGPFPILFRKMWLIGIICWIVSAMTYGLAQIVYAFFINKISSK